jgi:predicted ATPase
MKIELRSLRVINCGPLRDVCIHFAQDERAITVLGGANGSGKTTVLSLIATLFQLLHPDITEDFGVHITNLGPGIHNPIGYTQIDLLVNGKDFSIFYGRRPSDAKLPENYYGRAISDFGAITDDFKWRTDETQGELAGQIRERIRQQNETLVDFDGVIDIPGGKQYSSLHVETSLPSVLYFPHSRSLTPLHGEQVQREDTVYQWVYLYESVRAFSGSLDSYLIWLEYAEPHTFARVVDFLEALDFEGKVFSIRRKELKVVVTTRNGSEHYLEDLSSGEQNILIMLLELRRRLLPHSLVLIDELENSLHPAFQYRLAEMLKKMQEDIPFQLIVTTHSPAFVEIFGTQATRILTEF